MNILPNPHLTAVRSIVLGAAIAVTVVACGTGNNTPATATPGTPATPGTAGTPGSSATPGSTAPPVTLEPPASQEPDTGPARGDVPDNAIFLTYRDPKLGYSIEYVEGWQVTTTTDGVGIRDKDSSELVQVVPPQADVAAYVSGTDLPALRGQPGFKLNKQDVVTVKGRALSHLVYDIPAPPDPVTGKEVPSTVDRYYVPGPNGLAIVSLLTPKGVDNVDAFRRMIESFQWL